MPTASLRLSRGGSSKRSRPLRTAEYVSNDEARAVSYAEGSGRARDGEGEGAEAVEVRKVSRAGEDEAAREEAERRTVPLACVRDRGLVGAQVVGTRRAG